MNKIQEICVSTALGTKKLLCILRNEKESIYEIVDAHGKGAPTSLRWKIDRSFEIIVFSGIKIEGVNVFTFSPFSLQSHHIGVLREA